MTDTQRNELQDRLLGEQARARTTAAQMEQQARVLANDLRDLASVLHDNPCSIPTSESINRWRGAADFDRLLTFAREYCEAVERQQQAEAEVRKFHDFL